jgi:hypothetical protein
MCFIIVMTLRMTYPRSKLVPCLFTDAYFLYYTMDRTRNKEQRELLFSLSVLFKLYLGTFPVHKTRQHQMVTRFVNNELNISEMKESWLNSG